MQWRIERGRDAMNVKKLRLVNFKRFADLTVDLSSLEEAPKFILLIGANGSGKSSLFDAFEYLSGLPQSETTATTLSTRRRTVP